MAPNIRNDTAITAGILGYFIIMFVLMSLAGITDRTIIMPSNPFTSTVDSTNLTTSEQRQPFISAVLECIITTGIVGLPLGFIDAAITDLPLIDCTRQTQSALSKGIDAFLDTTIEALFSIVRFSFSFFIFMLQLLGFSLPHVPAYVTVIFVYPPIIALAAIWGGYIRGVKA